MLPLLTLTIAFVAPTPHIYSQPTRTTAIAMQELHLRTRTATRTSAMPPPGNSLALITSEEVRKAIGRGAERASTPTVVIFGAKACRACRQFRPELLRRLFRRHPEVSIMHVDYSAATKDAFAEFDVRQTPTVAVLLPRQSVLPPPPPLQLLPDPKVDDVEAALETRAFDYSFLGNVPGARDEENVWAAWRA